MKIHPLIPFAFALLAAVCVHAETYDFKESFSRTGAFSATGKISLKNINGSIAVETWDKNEIKIEGEKSAKTEEELKLIELTINLSDATADIMVRLPKRSGSFFGGKSIRGAVKFKLMVPASASLDRIQTVNSSVDIDGVRGETYVETVNGQIHAHDLGGKAHLETVNGGVEASFSAVTAHQDLLLKSVNGSIKAALPADSGFQLRSSVVNGRVSCDFLIDGQNRSKARQLAGKVGDGRTALTAESVNGSVHIEKR